MIVAVPDAADRKGLLAVTEILAGLAFPDRRFLDLFGGAEAMIESPVLDEEKEILRKRYETEGRVKSGQEHIIAFLDARFGSVSDEVRARVAGVTDSGRLEVLVRQAATCPDVVAFAASVGQES